MNVTNHYLQKLGLIKYLKFRFGSGWCSYCAWHGHLTKAMKGHGVCESCYNVLR
jgi:hypothetical protein